MFNIVPKEYHVLRDVSKAGKVNNWQEKKCKSLILSNVYKDLEFYSKFERVYNCGSFLEFKQFHDGSLKLNKANFCKDRLCPLCSWRRSLKIFGQVSQIMDVLSKDTSKGYIFVTFTIKNVSGEQLAATIDQLMKGYHNLFRTKKIKRLIKGGFRALEITHNTNRHSKSFDTFHPHLHCIFSVDSNYCNSKYRDRDYITQKEWVELWRNSLDIDYNPIVFVENIKKSADNLKKSVCEVAKYSVKDSDFLNEDNDLMRRAVYHLTTGINGRRLISFRGDFAKVKKELGLDDIVDGDLIHTDVQEDINEDLGYVILKYRWNIGFYNYCEVNDNYQFIKERESV